MSKYYVGQHIQATGDTNVDVSGATTKQLRITKPDGTIITPTASVVDTTKLRATLADTDVDQAGNWKFQTYAVISSEEYIGDTYNQKINALYT